jgi:2,3-bisphosphoglycerate-independent phosphoglycerate mutase
MGLEPEDAPFLKRGPIEAAGAGHTLVNGEIALRANFATVDAPDGNIRIVDRRAGRVSFGLDRLAETISNLDLGDGVHSRFYSTDQHRGVLVLSGDSLDASISDTDPGDAHLPARVSVSRAERPEAARTAEKINRFVDMAHHRLVQHPVNIERVQAGLLPANAVITRGAGAHVDIRNKFQQSGRRVAVIAGCNTVLGLGRLFDFDVVTHPRFTADTETDLDYKIEAAIEAAELNDVVIVHIKAPDTCAHDHNPMEKMKVLERLDSALGQLKGWDGVLGLSADHTTDSNSGRHTADPVPSLIAKTSSSSDTGPEDVNFGERLCRYGNLERQNSQSFVARFLTE